jgi:hypothetical protein
MPPDLNQETLVVGLRNREIGIVLYFTIDTGNQKTWATVTKNMSGINADVTPALMKSPKRRDRASIFIFLSKPFQTLTRIV